MAINLSEGYSIIPVGTHVFQITDVDYNDAFGKISVTMKTVKGQKHVERFYLYKNNGEKNDAALNAFSFFAKTALQDFTRTQIDEKELIGKYIRCEVIHNEVESTKRAGQTMVFVNLGQKSPADGFDDPDIPFDEPKTEPKKKSINLDDILG